ncbi:MAG: hypothetical protein ACLSE6_01425 [Alphaproteobacteria bacterium]
MEKARQFYARRGIDYMIVVAPNKEAMYSEYMPSGCKNSEIGAVAHGFGGGISAETHQG